MQTEKQTEFQNELAALLNRYSAENESDTPDFILAQYLDGCLAAWNRSVQAREKWYGRTPGLHYPNPDPANIDPSPRA